VSTQALELPVLPAPRIDEGTYRRLAKRVRLLSWLSLAWMTVEGAVAITAGAAASSIALIGFGLDSAIEGFASLIIVWRFTGSRMFSALAETRAQKLVAVQFFLLAPYVAFESARALIGGEHGSSEEQADADRQQGDRGGQDQDGPLSRTELELLPTTFGEKD